MTKYVVLRGTGGGEWHYFKDIESSSITQAYKEVDEMLPLTEGRVIIPETHWNFYPRGRK